MKLEEAWYNNSAWLKLLRPVECVFKALSSRRRKQFKSGARDSWKAPVPVIVVGNISVGGTGKSPVVIWLIEHLRLRGYNPGVVSRGYGAKAPQYPFTVSAEDSAAEAGDEPLMIVRRTGVPLVIDPDRVAATQQLLSQYPCDIVISDDGLQHYALQRSIELVVVDGSRGFGNGRCLPEGPLREPVSRLDEVDLILMNGEGDRSILPPRLKGKSHSMQLEPDRFINLSTGNERELTDWTDERDVAAVAAIGNPGRFVSTLQQLGFKPELYAFADHHRFESGDFQPLSGKTVIMTEKDAVKCDHLQLSDAWYLRVSARIDQAFTQQLDQQIKQLLKP